MSFFRSLKDKVSQKDKRDRSPYRSDPPTYDKKHAYGIDYQQGSGTIQGKSDTCAPPQGPPPSHDSSGANPPPYESWLSVPDTSQLPPPPSISNEFSPANNASFQSAEMGHEWCARNQIYTPSVPQHSSLIETSQTGELGLDLAPAGFKGSIRQLDKQTWDIKTEKRQPDAILTSTLPAYFAAVSNPLLTHSTQPITISLSITVHALPASSIIAIGFASKPYPPFRLPGWHRGSLALHSDDGNRYINDPYGGIDFTAPFRVHDTITVSMTIYPRPSPVQIYRGTIPDVRPVGGNLPKCESSVTVLRDGVHEGTWNVHEERDAERDEGIEGLQGEADLYCAVGVSGITAFTVRFDGQK